MRIIEKSETRLVVEDCPWGLGLFLIALTLFGVGMLFHGLSNANEVVVLAALVFAMGSPVAFVKAVRRARLSLDKSTGEVIWTVRDWQGYRIRRWPLSDFGRAFLHVEHDDGPKYRLTFTVAGEDTPIPLTIYHSNLGRPDKIAEGINEFCGVAEPDRSGAS